MSKSPVTKSEYLTHIGRPFLARRIAQLHDILSEQGQDLLKAAGIDLDARLGSVFHLVATRPGLSVVELADELGLSHQLASYRIRKLVEADLISQERDPQDRTRSVLEPTAKAAPVVETLHAVMGQLDQAYAALFEELGVDLLDIVTRTRKALIETPLLERTKTC